jgi:hypothetical protein
MRFVDEHRDRFAVALLLRVLQIGESTYYAWKRQVEQPCDRDLVDLGLLSNIHEIWEASGRAYGADRVHRQLRRNGIRVGRKRVERLMVSQGLAGRFLAPWLARRVDPAGSSANAGTGSGEPAVHCGRPEPVAGSRRYAHSVW